MNWKKALNPWGYARGLETELESGKKNSADWEFRQFEMCKKYSFAASSATSWKAQHDDLKGQLIDLKTELATALDALRIADERAAENATIANQANKELAELKVAKMRAAAAKPAKNAALIRSVTGVSPKVGAIPKRTATAPGGAKLVLKDSGKPNDGADAAYAKAVKGCVK